MIPKVKFKTNIELDIQMTHSFLEWGESLGGMDFSDSIFGPNPDLRSVNMDNEKEVNDYFKRVYSEREEDFKKVLDWNREHWGNVESEFMHKIITLFKGHEFPEGKYIGYLSINNCNPRFLEDKTFQMYYKAKVYNRTISHELTHFMFYNYTSTIHSKMFRDLDPNTGTYWSLAELFNNVILSLPDFVELLDNYGDGAYPNHENHYEPLVKIWKDTKDVDEFIINGFEYLEKNM